MPPTQEAVNAALLKTYPAYAIGSSVRFAFVGFDTAGFIDWYPIDARDFHWLPGSYPRIRFLLNSTAHSSGKRLLRLTYRSPGPQRVQVFVNGVFAGTLPIERAGVATLELPFEATMLQVPGLNTIEFRMPDVTYSAKTDVRTLSEDFLEFAIMPAP